MSASLFIVLEREIPGVDSRTVGGKFLSKNMEMLDEACRILNVGLLSAFISVNPDEAMAFLQGEGGDIQDLSFPPEHWFEAEDGIKVIQALISHVESKKAGETRLLQDLHDSLRVLSRAKDAKVRFHLAVDF